MSAVAPTDALVVAEGWISEHYFTTDAKKESFLARALERRAEWDAHKDSGTTRTRVLGARQQLLAAYAGLGQAERETAEALNEDIIGLLGYEGVGYTHERRGPVRLVRGSGLDEPLVALVSAQPQDTVEALLAKDGATLLAPYLQLDGSEIASVARLVSALFVADDHRPAFALVVAGRHLVVAEQERWAEGRYLSIDLQLVLERSDERKGGELDRALACVDAASIAPNAEGDIWWHETLSQSVAHTVGVSADLREGVRLSIEDIANEVLVRRSGQGLGELEPGFAQALAKQSLRFLYRILFLLYAEASPELGVLPAGAQEYEGGYSMDRLRDLTLVELSSPQAQDGTHLYESLAVLFRLIDEGFEPAESAGQGVEGLTFRSLRADLFRPEATALIDEVGLGNEAMQRVLQRLLLSKESASHGRGFISYAELGINQLGAVYEGLMSYTGFFATEDLYEVAKNGDASKGSWVVPVARADGISPDDFVRSEDPETGEAKPVLHRRGTFVYRLAGRERQQSASYYTPEVLTRFVVSQALDELLDQDGQHTSAGELLQLSVCEPALGSGAFAIEAVRQLAEQYLERRQRELGERIDPEKYPRELQRVKAYLALHQVYGVDLNATAVELAEISLWLDTMVEGLDAPWFGLHLRRGNSLIGGLKAVYSRDQVTSKAWLKATPQRVGSGEDERPEIAGAVPHFLLPAEGWGAAAGVEKSIRELVPDEVKALKAWSRNARTKPTKKQVDALVDMGHRVERLWHLAARRLEIAEAQVRRDLPVWGMPAELRAAPQADRVVTREEIEESLNDPNGAYRRLRRVMDAWCALWFWPLTETDIAPPTTDEWYDALRALLGVHKHKGTKDDEQMELADEVGWDQLGALEQLEWASSGAEDVGAVRERHPWLAVCERIADRQGFFHWELDFAPVFGRGGFDLQVGNPPWVRPRTDQEALLAEGDPWWQLASKPTQAQKAERRQQTLALDGIAQLLIDGTSDTVAASDALGWVGAYPALAGLQPNTYRCFMETVWRNRSPGGASALIHPETHFTDDKAARLREATYRRIRRHWQFINALMLFEVHDQTVYGVHVYGGASAVSFRAAHSLYHPDTIVRSLVHDGSGPEPGIKDDHGDWDLRPHRNRIVEVNEATLERWRDLLESPDTPVLQTRSAYPVNRAIAGVLDALVGQERVSSLGLEFSRGWDESIDRKKGFFETEWGRPDSWDDVILQGPHFYVNVPFYKVPNETLKHNQDWSSVDLETLQLGDVPTTAYKPRGSRAKYDASYTHWAEDGSIPARSAPRLAWRAMAANTNERTLISTIIPPGAAHVHGVSAVGVLAPGGTSTLALIQGYASSLVHDVLIRVVPKSGVMRGSFWRLPIGQVGGSLAEQIVGRVLRLNCLTAGFGALWEDARPATMETLEWTGGITYPGRRALGDAAARWDPASPLRRASDRRQAQLEIDAAVALALGLSADALCTIYRTAFPVLRGYDQNIYIYDANGRIVPNEVLTVWRKRGDEITEDERTATNPSGNTYVYELPFRALDREADMRQAYAHFEQLMAKDSAGG